MLTKMLPEIKPEIERNFCPDSNSLLSRSRLLMLTKCKAKVFIYLKETAELLENVEPYDNFHIEMVEDSIAQFFDNTTLFLYLHS
ncbi:hypothetical protein CEXT_103321 [Caerostris extrusa]|uniref:Uncharacterized protein n=1 Tax=Caerostris extrusa TaxID=172846 RepID=A0AAV4TSZ9_CAEEX|nr:hypothetical protein CEXT_103321 [Caerostris extrusa]